MGLGCFPFDNEAYPPLSHSRDFTHGIRSLIGVGTLVRALAHSVLYHHVLPLEAVLKGISRRTSYHQTRLAFHSDTQLIREIFNAHRFGPPRGVTRASPWSRVDRLASGLTIAINRPIRTRFRYGSEASAS